MFLVLGETEQLSVGDDYFAVSTSQAYLCVRMPNVEHSCVRLWFTPLAAACLQEGYNGTFNACVHTLPVWRDVLEQMHKAFA